jgi:hypothetical protein
MKVNGSYLIYIDSIAVLEQKLTVLKIILEIGQLICDMKGFGSE